MFARLLVCWIVCLLDCFLFLLLDLLDSFFCVCLFVGFARLILVSKTLVGLLSVDAVVGLLVCMFVCLFVRSFVCLFVC